MFQNRQVFHFVLILFISISDVLSNTNGVNVINKSNITICFPTNDALDINVLSDDIKSVDGRRFYGFLAKIGWTSASGEVSFHCGGTLISTKFVLSVAHCMDIKRPMYKNQPDTVRVAERLFDGSIVGDDIQIDSIYTHHLYGVLSMYHDIALIKLMVAVRYRPACIWTGAVLPTTDIFALGHDLQKIGTQQVMSLKFVNSADCDLRYSPSRKLPDGIINSQICAGKSNITEGEKCKGHIGGPLLTQVVENSNEVFIVGLTNFGQRCSSDDDPNIYTKLSSYKDWIMLILNTESINS